METTFCQTAEFELRKSPITGRSLKLNLSLTKCLVEPSKVFDAMVHAEQWSSTGRPANKPIADSIRAFKQIESCEDFMLKIDALLEAGQLSEKSFGQKNHVFAWLFRLWVVGIIAIPRDFPFSTKISIFPNEFMLSGGEWLLDIQSAFRAKNKRNVIGLAFKIAGRTLGVLEPGDIVPETIADLNFTADAHRNIQCFVTPLLTVQRHRYGEKASYSRESWGVGRNKQKIGVDREFNWVGQEDSSIIDWSTSFTNWLKDQRQGLALRTYMAERVLTYMIQNPQLPRSVAQYCLRRQVIQPTWGEWSEGQRWALSSQRHYANYFADFLDWYIANFLTDEDDFGRPISSPEHFNPIVRQRISGRQAETHREALPLRYMNELIRILSEDDFAWGRGIRSDYFMWPSPDGSFAKIWNPVRTYAILLKLMLPLRTYQVRMLDSGECDTERFVGGMWAKNDGELVNAVGRKRPVKRGFLRKFRDSITGHEFTGFFINTNKTADAGKDQKDRGYEIPWQHEDVIKIAQDLRAWQETYNPLLVPTKWESIHDRTVLRSYTGEMLKSRSPVCFLFRDPCGVYPNEPVLDSRLQPYWAQLLEELERRVSQRGETLATGEPIRFVQESGPRTVTAIYDLHTLRVSLITAYATEGGVPIQILSKCVAGHASILMTLYYNKPGPAFVSAKLADAQEKIQQSESENFLRFLQNEEVRAASPMVVSNGQAGLTALEGSRPGTWVVGDLGICPVGGSLCHQGGPILNSAQSKPHYSPAPGAPKNCVRCRYFITGPAFLGGLVAHFNAVGVGITESAERLRCLEQEIFAIEDSEPVHTDREANRRLSTAYARRDRVLEQVDTDAHNWHATFGLVERCKVALTSASTNKDGRKLDLILSGSLSDLRVAVAECSDFELYDAVCQRARIYPNENIVTANLRRGRLLDAMLARNGKKPLFAVLTESDALEVGNQFVELLMARVGREDVNAIIEGRRMLDDSGLSLEIEKILKSTQTPALSLDIN